MIRNKDCCNLFFVRVSRSAVVSDVSFRGSARVCVYRPPPTMEGV